MPDRALSVWASAEPRERLHSASGYKNYCGSGSKQQQFRDLGQAVMRTSTTDRPGQLALISARFGKPNAFSEFDPFSESEQSSLGSIKLSPPGAANNAC